MDLANRHVVITGASRGIGAATAKAFAGAGADLTLVARDAEALGRVAGPLGAASVVADVADPHLADRIAERRPIDVLVHNAGVAAVGSFLDHGLDELCEMETTNGLAPTLLTRLVLPGMVGRGAGRIVFVSSQSAHVVLPGLTAYSAGKAGLSRLATGLQRELRGTGVGVTLAEIGTTRTGIHDELVRRATTGRALRRLRRLGLVRILDPEEVADAVVAACRRDRDLVVLPRRARLQSALDRLPQRVTDAALDRLHG